MTVSDGPRRRLGIYGGHQFVIDNEATIDPNRSAPPVGDPHHRAKFF
jgi:hypothetical protein